MTKEKSLLEWELVRDLRNKILSDNEAPYWMWALAKHLVAYGWSNDPSGQIPADPFKLCKGMGYDGKRAPHWLFDLACHLSEKGWRKK